VGVNHGRFDIIIPKQLLYRADTGTRFLQMKAATYKTKNQPPSASVANVRWFSILANLLSAPLQHHQSIPMEHIK